ncbi:hypothetical protein JAAARDRAFT_39665 [Jaapia argillacea MUCL 33604]|uniref:Rho GDP-dissociation inhibitor n=1 Tax=Jaapia argillacea MUCL 33604 TaxID=933084 RepID=A0A067PDY8_9AGAM|nr:hypothetical protein JAAARDRAFT_39665 [Jaapia argillacea MUCL 33604]
MRHPPLEVLTFEIVTKEAGKGLSIDLNDPKQLEDNQLNPVVLKEGIKYNVRLTFTVKDMVLGLRFREEVYLNGVPVAKESHFIGSYSPMASTTHTCQTEKMPSGIRARSGVYTSVCHLVDDDRVAHATWQWSFQLVSEW